MKLNLKKILFFLTLAALFTPFIFDKNSYFPFITAKTSFFRIIVEIMTAIWVCWLIKEKKKLSLSILQQLILLYFIILVLSALWGINPLFSFFSGNERLLGIWGIAHFVLFFFILSTVFQKEEWEKIIQIEVILSTFYSLFSLVGFPVYGKISAVATWGRLAGLTGNPSYFATYLIFNSFLALWLYFRQWRITKKLGNWWLAIFVFLSMLIFATGTRGGMIGYLSGLIFVIFYFLFSSQKELLFWKRISAAVLIILVSTLGILYFLRNTAFVQRNFALERLTSISLKDPTAVSRLYSAQTAFKGFLERPILGWGPENYQAPYMKYLNPKVLKYLPSDFIFDRAHNEPMEVLATTGILGFISYLSIFFYLAWSLWKKRKEEGWLLKSSLFLGLLIAYFVQNLFLFDFHESYLMLFLVLALLDVSLKKEKEINSSSQEEKNPKEDFSSELGKLFLIITVICLAIVGISFGVVKPYLISRGIISIQKDIYYQHTKEAEKRLRYLLNHPSFLQEDIIEGTRKILERETNLLSSDENLQRMTQLLIDKGKQLYFRHPERFMLETTLAQLGTYTLSWTSIRKAETQTFLDDLVNKYPRVPLLYVYYARFLLLTQQPQLALEQLEKAVQLDPANAAANYFLYLIYKKEGKLAKAIDYLVKSVQAGVRFYTKSAVLKAAADLAIAKRYDLIVKVYQQGIALDPKDPALYSHLAATYAKLHNQKKAIEYARKVLELNPKAKQAVEEFIQLVKEKQWDKIAD